jgi:hypothetical protein
VFTVRLPRMAVKPLDPDSLTRILLGERSAR